MGGGDGSHLDITIVDTNNRLPSGSPKFLNPREIPNFLDQRWSRSVGERVTGSTTSSTENTNSSSVATQFNSESNVYPDAIQTIIDLGIADPSNLTTLLNVSVEDQLSDAEILEIYAKTTSNKQKLINNGINPNDPNAIRRYIKQLREEEEVGEEETREEGRF